MRLFTINELYEVELNKEWVMMIPEFAVLIRRDKGSAGDYRGEKKLKAKRELAYIYFCLDFTSPLREWEDDERKAEALRYAGLSADDIDDKVLEAWTTYEVLLHQSSRSLKTLNALKKGMDQLDNYFQNVNFETRDKQGKAYYTPEAYIGNISKLPKMNEAVKQYEKMVEEELKADGGIRGKRELGGKEGTRRTDKVWQEGGPPSSDPDSADRETIEL